MEKPTIMMGTTLALICAMTVFAQPINATEADSKPQKQQAVYSDQAFLDAAFNNCTVVLGRSPESCTCEQKLLSNETAVRKVEDRLTLDDKEMAFFYYVDQPRFKKESQEKRSASPSWAANFSRKMTHLQALMIAACGA